MCTSLQLTTTRAGTVATLRRPTAGRVGAMVAPQQHRRGRAPPGHQEPPGRTATACTPWNGYPGGQKAEALRLGLISSRPHRGLLNRGKGAHKIKPPETHSTAEDISILMLPAIDRLRAAGPATKVWQERFPRLEFHLLPSLWRAAWRERTQPAYWQGRSPYRPSCRRFEPLRAP